MTSAPISSIHGHRAMRTACYLACAALFTLAVAYSAELLVRPMHYGSPFAPMPIPLVLPAFIGFGQLSIFVFWVACFVAWNPTLLRGQASAPLRGVWLWGMCAMVSLIDFGTGWHHGLRYQGRATVQAWLVASIVIGCASFALLACARRRPSYCSALAAHTLLWLWPVTFAAPWLGEGWCRLAISLQ